MVENEEEVAETMSRVAQELFLAKDKIVTKQKDLYNKVKIFIDAKADEEKEGAKVVKDALKTAKKEVEGTSVYLDRYTREVTGKLTKVQNEIAAIDITGDIDEALRSVVKHIEDKDEEVKDFAEETEGAISTQITTGLMDWAESQ